MRRTWIALALTLAIAPAVQSAQAQAREISGKVTQVGTGMPLAEATVSVVGAQLGVRTNERGEFRLRVPDGNVSVLARAIGYKRDTKLVGAGQSTVDFTLERRGDATNVTWTMQGAVPYFAKIIHLFVNMDRMVGTQFEAGLASLKTIAEKTP